MVRFWSIIEYGYLINWYFYAKKIKNRKTTSYHKNDYKLFYIQKVYKIIVIIIIMIVIIK